MGDPFEPRFSLFERKSSAFGDEFKLTLDPEIEQEINRLRFKLVFDRLESNLYRPDWSVIDLLLRPKLIADAPVTGNTPPGLIPVPPATTGACGSGSSWKVPEPPNPEMRKGEASDILQAVWKLPVVECKVNEISSTLQKQWSRFDATEKTAVIATSIVIGGATLSGILSNDSSRTWVLQKISGTYIPVPKVDGLKFAILAPDGLIRGGGVSYDSKLFDVKGSFEQKKLPDNTQFNDIRLELNLNVGEAINQIDKLLKK
jgi:hypothetical protein